MSRFVIAASVVLICLNMSLAAPAARAQAQTQTVEIPFSVSSGLIVIQANVNGKSVSLLFDSGAMRTFVKPSVVHGLKTTSGYAISVTDGNTREVRVVKTVVSLGDVSVPVLVSCYDMTPFIASMGLRIDGVIGQDVIGKFSRISIDYVGRKITLIE